LDELAALRRGKKLAHHPDETATDGQWQRRDVRTPPPFPTRWNSGTASP